MLHSRQTSRGWDKLCATSSVWPWLFLAECHRASAQVSDYSNEGPCRPVQQHIWLTMWKNTLAVCQGEIGSLSALAWRRSLAVPFERLPIFQGFRLRNHSLKSTPALPFNKFMVFVFSFSCSSSSVNWGSPSAIRGKKRGSGDLAWCHFLCSPGEEKCFPSYHGLWQAWKPWTLWHVENLKK